MGRTRQTWWVVGGIVVVAVIALVLVLARSGREGAGRKQAGAAATPAAVPSPTATPETGIPAGVSLNTSDAFVRQVVSGLSRNPALVTWLASKDLIRRFVGAVDRIAHGRSPRPQLGFLRPRRPFRVRRAGRALVADPRSFHRYDLVADVFASLDTAGTVKALDRLQPLLDDAYREIGRPGSRFRDALEAAIVELLKTPAIPADVRLKEKVVTYMYADPGLEKLDPAQRLLLRMGPENVRHVQTKLRELALALGMPAEKLPKPQVYRPARD